MNSARSKINAFTLAELLVVIAVSAVVVGLAFTAINLLRKNMHHIQANYSQKSQWQLLEQQLALDFARYPKITYSPLSQKVNFSSPLDSVVYLLEENYVLRDRDTLLGDQYNTDLFFQGEKISEGSIDALKIFGGKEFNTKTIFVYRKNDALTILNYGD